jgi:hypothetical protein
MLKEGDFVMGSTSEGVVHGVIEHIMIEGGVYGVPGTEYAIQSMPPDNPAMAVRIYEQEDGEWEPTAYSIGMMYQDASIVDMENSTMDSETEMAMFDAQMGKTDDSMMPTDTYQSNKQAPCWDGYVQRGMKPGADGNPVPNCVPAAKLDSMFAGFGKDYTRSTTNIYRTEE